MSKNKHMTLENRTTIQTEPDKGTSFKEISIILGKDCTTISKEVRKHIYKEKTGAMGKTFNDCLLNVKRQCPSAPCVPNAPLSLTDPAGPAAGVGKPAVLIFLTSAQNFKSSLCLQFLYRAAKVFPRKVFLPGTSYPNRCNKNMIGKTTGNTAKSQGLIDKKQYL